MSIYPSPDKLDTQESKFALVILAAKRARQVKDGARKLINTQSPNPITVALEEIAAGTIISRTVEDATVNAYKVALRPNEPTIEDIIGAGPVLSLDNDSMSAMDAFRNMEPDGDDDDLLGGTDDEDIRPIDALAESPGMMSNMDEDDERNDNDTEDDN
ncbi:MAG: DNA-directed RNA polymerase subunit omega [Chthonomonadaceae bacterium]|nr:DNA-directed RNA polymerase subunit omega [Chthonomonadaceae bacterium]